MAAKKLDAEAMKAAREAKALGEKAKAAGLPDIVETTAKVHDTFKKIEGLPSKNLFYNSHISGSPPKLEDCILLHSVNEGNIIDSFNQVFMRRIHGEKPRSILVADELYLVFWLREAVLPGMGYPHEAFQCPHCGKINPADDQKFAFGDVDFDLPDLESIVSDFREGNGKIKVELPDSKAVYYITPRTRGHIERQANFLEREYTSLQIDVPTEIFHKSNLAAILSTDTTNDIKDIIDSLHGDKISVRDYMYLKAKVLKYSIASEPKITVKCSFCEEVSPSMGYVFQPTLFLPDD